MTYSVWAHPLPSGSCRPPPPGLENGSHDTTKQPSTQYASTPHADAVMPQLFQPKAVSQAPCSSFIHRHASSDTDCITKNLTVFCTPNACVLPVKQHLKNVDLNLHCLTGRHMACGLTNAAIPGCGLFRPVGCCPGLKASQAVPTRELPVMRQVFTTS